MLVDVDIAMEHLKKKWLCGERTKHWAIKQEVAGSKHDGGTLINFLNLLLN